MDTPWVPNHLPFPLRMLLRQHLPKQNPASPFFLISPKLSEANRDGVTVPLPSTSVLSSVVPSTYQMSLRVDECNGEFGRCNLHNRELYRPFTSEELALALWICQAVFQKSLRGKALVDQILGFEFQGLSRLSLLI